MMVALAALVLGGCAYTPETTVKVRDPSAVQVDIEDGQGKLVTVLPPAATASEAKIPSTSPPWAEGLRPEVVMRRLAAGPIEIRCEDCSPQSATLVALDGVVDLDDPFEMTSHPWTKSEMRIRFRDKRDAAYSTTTAYDAEVATPWTNVARVVRIDTPDRGLGFKLLASAAVLAVLGGFALQDGLSLHHSTTTAFAAIVLPLTIPLGATGIWYFFAPPQVHVIYGDKGQAE
jgi:hypothetical protein